MKNNLYCCRKSSSCVLFCFSFVLFFAQIGQGQDIKKQLKAAIKSEEHLSWEAENLYQAVLENPAFVNLNLAEKLNVYERLTWYYNVTGKYTKAEPISYEAVRLRETSRQNKSVKKDDIYYTSTESRWYTQALQWHGKTLLALNKYKEAQATFRKAFEAYGKFNYNPWQKWEILVEWGRSYYLDGNFQAAIPLYREAFELRSPDGTYFINETHYINAEARCDLANIYRDLGDVNKAEPLYLNAIKIMDSGVYKNKSIKGYDEVRIKNFLGYEKLLRLQNRNAEADNFRAKAESIIQSGKK